MVLLRVRRELVAGLDVGDSFCHQLGHDAANLVIGLLDALGVEIHKDFAAKGVVQSDHQIAATS